ncbi:cell division protein FtsL [Chitinilyticum piscinae]|uniref:Cell division protein FtsL n=1 Tax=Chitinilyticum piscinae TaxID=2866724 RepID=A0A8J7K131_9NEIS|nr:cell division protein FtsL [Chitinilyticum piscinae]MBE9608047.1 cell division protein FtsL [Chitinilyticum piscinae]
MIRLNLFLLGLVILCALSVVTSSHRARKLYGELQKEESTARKLEVEWGQLQLEQSTWAIHSRIELEAASRLGMQVPAANRSVAVPSDKPASAAPGPQ